MKFSKKYQNDFLNFGYCICKVKNKNDLKYIYDKIKKISQTKNLNFYHKNINKNNLNSNRLKIFNLINKDMVFRKKYFNIFKEYLEDIVGNEILMQKLT